MLKVYEKSEAARTQAQNTVFIFEKMPRFSTVPLPSSLELRSLERNTFKALLKSLSQLIAPASFVSLICHRSPLFPCILNKTLEAPASPPQAPASTPKAPASLPEAPPGP